uniref:riboflavin kinase n=1 Tax=Alexandrium monilatum TaxID=311494 RepID=A0A7S4PUV5_9DINO
MAQARGLPLSSFVCARLDLSWGLFRSCMVQAAVAEADGAAGPAPEPEKPPAPATASSSAVDRAREALEPMPRLRAKVVHGFGRGSKVLGFPTANMEVRWDKEQEPETLEPHEREILEFAQSCRAGIYYAWAQVSNGPDRGVYKAAMSVGWNPTFTDVKRKTIEPWILHDYTEDFYECELRLIICGFVRPELKFDKFEDLIVAIREDGDFCGEALAAAPCADVASDGFFAEAPAKA